LPASLLSRQNLTHPGMTHASSICQRSMCLAFGPANERIAAAPQRGELVLGSSDGQRDGLQIIHSHSLA